MCKYSTGLELEAKQVVHRTYAAARDSIDALILGISKVNDDETSLLEKHVAKEEKIASIKVEIQQQVDRVETMARSMAAKRIDHHDRIKQISIYHDVNSWIEHLAEVGGNANGKNLHAWALNVRHNLEFADYALNNVQLAVTIAIAQHLKKGGTGKMQVWSIPAGHGKSRVIVGLIASLFDTKFRFRVIYNHRELLDEDKPKIEEMRLQVGGADIEYIVADNVAGEFASVDVSDPNLVTIIDEVDNVLIDSRYILDNKKCKSKVIGLTATATGDFLNLETDVLDAYNFQVLDSKITSSRLDVKCLQPLSVNSFITKSFGDKARLMFVDDADIPSLEYSLNVENPGITVYRNHATLADLRQLTPNHVCLVSEVRLMRGFDYRCKEGINLLIAKQVDSQRTLIQALSRVGRYGEVCSRYVREDLKDRVVDAGNSLALAKNANKIIARISARPAKAGSTVKTAKVAKIAKAPAKSKGILAFLQPAAVKADGPVSKEVERKEAERKPKGLGLVDRSAASSVKTVVESDGTKTAVDVCKDAPVVVV